ncbi:MAG: lysophospholipid acyltransferase family protein [Candidatus Omnitrophica bacterium]|nr:lysophospholipid acyltransferase family protein [Candidatus Omnitrophota bacterium]
MAYRFSRFILSVFLNLFFEFKVEGRENLPKQGGFILACNHISYLDPVVLGVGCLRSVHFMARDTLFNNRFLAFWMKAVGVIPVKRDKADFSALKKSLNIARSGEGLAIFPEGTRRLPDKAFMNPEPGVGFLADKAGVPVIPAFIKGTYEALPKGVNRKINFGREIRLRFGKEIHIERGKPYQETSDLIMANIKQLSNN